MAELWSVDPIDKLHHMVAWLDALGDLWESRDKEIRFSVNGSDGFDLILMHIRDQIKEASDTLYESLKRLDKALKQKKIIREVDRERTFAE